MRRQSADQHHDTGPPRHLSQAPRHDAGAGDVAAGINVAFGHDCVHGPMVRLGRADMLEVAHMGLHVGQMTGREAMRSCFDAVTSNAGARCWPSRATGWSPAAMPIWSCCRLRSHRGDPPQRARLQVIRAAR